MPLEGRTLAKKESTIFSKKDQRVERYARRQRELNRGMGSRGHPSFLQSRNYVIVFMFEFFLEIFD